MNLLGVPPVQLGVKSYIRKKYRGFAALAAACRHYTSVPAEVALFGFQPNRIYLGMGRGFGEGQNMKALKCWYFSRVFNTLILKYANQKRLADCTVLPSNTRMYQPDLQLFCHHTKDHLIINNKRTAYGYMNLRLAARESAGFKKNCDLWHPA